MSLSPTFHYEQKTSETWIVRMSLHGTFIFPTLINVDIASECERIASALGRVENLGEIGERQQTVIHLVGLDTAAVYHWV